MNPMDVARSLKRALDLMGWEYISRRGPRLGERFKGQKYVKKLAQMVRNKRKLKVIYQSNWSTATPQQKKEYAERLDRACDMIFQKILEREINKTKGE